MISKDTSATIASPAEKIRSASLPILSALMDHKDYAIKDDPAYFARHLEAIHSPLILPGMEEGVNLLRKAVETGGKVYVLGDRDVDGVASTAMLGSFLRDSLGYSLDKNENQNKEQKELFLRVSDDGDDYGLRGEILSEIISDSAELVILLDMGSAHGEEIRKIVESGKRVIVLDHHQLQNPPQAGDRLAFINPLNASDIYEHSGLTPTVSIVLKFLLAYAISFTREWNAIHLVEGQDPDGERIFHSYRVGKYMGSFDSLEEAKRSLAEKHPELEIIDSSDDTDPSVQLETDILRFIQHDPVSGGKWIFAKLIRSRPRLREFFLRQADLCALGIITDMMPLIGENRALVRSGIGLMEGRPIFRPGYRALVRNLKIPETMIFSRDLGWSLGPVLNAAGRMGNTALALELLLASDEESGRDLASKLVSLNRERKNRTSYNERIVLDYFGENPHVEEDPVVFCYHEDLKPGVSGIVATRLTEKYKKPVIYINPDGDYARGSARTWNGKNVLRLLNEASDHLIQFGGHESAAGFSIAYDRIDTFRNCVMERAVSLFNEDSDKSMDDEYPAHLELTPGDLHYRLWKELETLEPFGPGNPEPVFLIRNATLHTIKYMSDGTHVKYHVRGAPSRLSFVAWKQGADFQNSHSDESRWDLYGCLEQSHFAGRTDLQFRVERMVISK